MPEEVYKCCADVGPQGFCTRRKEHDGPHKALYIDVEWGSD